MCEARRRARASQLSRGSLAVLHSTWGVSIRGRAPSWVRWRRFAGARVATETLWGVRRSPDGGRPRPPRACGRAASSASASGCARSGEAYVLRRFGDVARPRRRRGRGRRGADPPAPPRSRRPRARQPARGVLHQRPQRGDRPAARPRGAAGDGGAGGGRRRRPTRAAVPGRAGREPRGCGSSAGGAGANARQLSRDDPPALRPRPQGAGDRRPLPDQRGGGEEARAACRRPGAQADGVDRRRGVLPADARARPCLGLRA